MRTDFHAQHSTLRAAADPATCWYCGRERAKCRRKLWYPHVRDADRAAAQMRGSSYDCPWCNGFHVTTRVRGRVSA
jgi:hypothetical protein